MVRVVMRHDLLSWIHQAYSPERTSARGFFALQIMRVFGADSTTLHQGRVNGRTTMRRE